MRRERGADRVSGTASPGTSRDQVARRNGGMRRLGIAAVGALIYSLLSAASAFAQSDIPPEVGGEVVAPGGDVVVPPGASGGVAFTGTDVAVWMLVAAGLFVVGVAFLIAARRRARRVRT